MKKIFFAILILTTILTFGACNGTKKPEENTMENTQSSETNTKENTTTEDVTNESDAKGANLYTDQELLSLPESPVEDFSYSIEDGVVIIDKYTGEDLVIVVPAQIEGCNVEVIDKNAFSRGAEIIVLGKNIKKVNKNAFKNANVKKVLVNGPLETIEEYAFYMSDIEEINLPNTLKHIGMYAFGSMSNLKSITIPKSVESIDMCVFSMSGVKEVIFEDGSSVIGSAMFFLCDSLEKVILPNSIEFFKENGRYFADSADGVASDKLTIITPAGSAAEEYAKANRIPVEHP